MAVPSEPLVFGTAYESLVRALGNAVDDPLRHRFLGLGVDLNKLRAAYPLATWIEALKIAAELLAPGQPMETASYVVGRKVLESYAWTTIGRATFGFLRVIGTKRGFEQIRRSFKTTNNYSESTFVEVAPGVFHLWINLVTYPHYYRGLLDAGMELLGQKSSKVTLIKHDPTGATFEVRFRA